MILSAVIASLTGCRAETRLQTTAGQDTAAAVFGPSLAELFCEGGIGYRLAAVDRYSTWPPELTDLPSAGDFLSPSLEVLADLGVTSIHVVGTNNSLISLASQLEIPCYTYSFDNLEDIMTSASRLEQLYEDADLSEFRMSVLGTLDSLEQALSQNALNVMAVIHLEQDGAVTLAGRNTFFGDIIEEAGCVLSAPDAGSYPSVSVEGILSMHPDRIIILAPDGDTGQILDMWKANGLETEGVFVLTGDHVLIPGARLPRTIREMGSCLN